ncbi:MAG: PHB depolymerase family esterase [Pirellulales bacterium]
MRISRSTCGPSLGCAVGAWVGVVLAAGMLSGDTITLRNGMQVRGSVGKIASIHENPLSANSDPTAPTPVVFVDDQLRRTYFPGRQVRADGFVAENPVVERIRIGKRVANGTKRIGAVGPVLKITPFDQFGNRTYTMQTGQGPLTVVQGITEVSPLFAKVEGLQVEGALMWDMRISTASVPREILSKVLRRQIDATNPDQRLRIVRLYTQAERYEDARQELAEIVRDFPELADFKKQERELLQLSAGRLFQEAELRRTVGQHQLAIELLKTFPTDGIAGETLVKVREALQEYEERFQQGKQAVEKLAALVADLETAKENQTRVDALLREIRLELNFNTLPRLADFLRFADDPDTKNDQKVSLALSGWLLGAGMGTNNLSVALSLAEVRDLTRKYLRSTTPGERAEVLEQLTSQEGATPANIARLLAQMKPPLEFDPDQTGNAEVPGLHTLSIPGISEQADFTYHVQLPPEYDPLRRYPCVVTLGNPTLSARDQMQWWTGRFDTKLKMHLGQAARQGYIVLAPEWTREHQQRYEYSAREHAAVMYSLRDALRRFAIDTDRVYLSGHSMGGDAAWDIALAHPDLWAGVIPVVASADKYVSRYWGNGRYVPMYFVAGELDADKMSRNSEQFDRYMKFTGFDVMVTEYLGRGHEHFQEDQLRIFDWMRLHQREFYPKEFQCISLRPWDNFFWYVEYRDFQSKTMVLPANWPPPRNTSPAMLGGKITENNGVSIDLGGAKATVWLSPDMVDFGRRIQVNGKGQTISPSVETLLEDVRTRGDRQHPFWAKVNL